MPKFILSLLIVFSCGQAFSGESSTNIIAEKDLNEISYKTTAKYNYNNYCNSLEEKDGVSIVYQGIKSITAMEKNANTYPRYTLIKEVYASDELAAASYSYIKEYMQLNHSSWYQKTCSIKEGVQRNNVVYYLATDAYLFNAELTTIFKKIQKLLK